MFQFSSHDWSVNFGYINKGGIYLGENLALFTVNIQVRQVQYGCEQTYLLVILRNRCTLKLMAMLKRGKLLIQMDFIETILIYFAHLIISVYRCFPFSYSLMNHKDPCIVSACIC